MWVNLNVVFEAVIVSLVIVGLRVDLPNKELDASELQRLSSLQLELVRLARDCHVPHYHPQFVQVVGLLMNNLVHWYWLKFELVRSVGERINALLLLDEDKWLHLGSSWLLNELSSNFECFLLAERLNIILLSNEPTRLAHVDRLLVQVRALEVEELMGVAHPRGRFYDELFGRLSVAAPAAVLVRGSRTVVSHVHPSLKIEFFILF